MSQGAQGEGDKETFLWAAVDAGNLVYSVSHAVQAIGHSEKDGRWQGMAMVQHDPHVDYVNRNSPRQQKLKPRPLFIHANYPKKMDPASFFETGSDHTKDSDGIMTRIFHPTAEESIQAFGFDLERRISSVIREMGCNYEGRFKAWEGKENVCKKATQYWRALYSEADDELAVDASYCVDDSMGGEQYRICGVV